METRELFERLVTDEPPLSLAAAAMCARGRAAAQRRWAGRAAGTLAAVVVVALGAVQLTHERSDSAPSDTGAAPSVTPTSSYAAFAFASSGQVSSASSRAYAELLKAGEALGPLPRQTSVAAGTASPGVPGFFEAQIQLPSTSPYVLLDLVVADAALAKKQFGGALQQGPCAMAMPNISRADSCQRRALPGGGTLWTSENLQSSDAAPASSSPDVSERVALLVAGDGSALRVEEFAELPSSGADQPLPASGTLSGAQLSELASSAARAWVGGAASPIAVPARVPAASAQSSTEAMPSLGGPGITTLSFSAPAQIVTSNAAVYAQLVAAAGGKAALLKGWPTWDSAPVTSTTAFLGTQVQWPVGADSAYLQVVTDTAADARSRYGAALAGGPCPATTLGPGATERVICEESPLPGGAKAVAWQVSGPLPDASGATDATSPVGVLERHVLVVARDGSVLSVAASAQRGHRVGGGTPVGLPKSLPDAAGLVTLAAQLAQAWEAGAV